jgi:eukaryotic-like serine/threonine-protein kinase
MSARITVTATGGPCKGREFVFTGRTICTVGHSDSCLLRIQGDACDLTVSRRHCLLEIDPPAVRVRDLGSRNGTFVNGRKIGQREQGTPPREAAPADLAGVELYNGDRLALGGCEFLVGIQRGAVSGASAEGPQEAEAVEPAGFAACGFQQREQVPGGLRRDVISD